MHCLAHSKCLLTAIILEVLFTITKNKWKLKFQQEDYRTLYLPCVYPHTVYPSKIITSDFRNAEVMLNEYSSL